MYSQRVILHSVRDRCVKVQSTLAFVLLADVTVHKTAATGVQERCKGHSRLLAVRFLVPDVGSPVVARYDAQDHGGQEPDTSAGFRTSI